MKTFLITCMMMVTGICGAHDGANFVASDLLKSMSGNDKAAIVMVYFGTTHDDTRVLTIDGLTRQVREMYPDLDVREAYTSRTVIQRLGKRGIVKQTPLETLEELKAEGFTHIVMQPTSIIEGVEMEALRREAAHAASDFKDLRVGNPLLYTLDDYKMVISELTEPAVAGQGVVWVGHGTYTPATAQYAMLDYMLTAEGHTQYAVATVEGYPLLDDAEAKLSKGGVKRFVLRPLMFVAGDHAKNDIAGDMKEALEAKGYDVEVLPEGLGQHDGIRRIFLNHLRHAMHHKMTDIIVRKKQYAMPGYEYGHDECRPQGFY